MTRIVEYSQRTAESDVTDRAARQCSDCGAFKVLRQCSHTCMYTRFFTSTKAAVTRAVVFVWQSFCLQFVCTITAKVTSPFH